jgi:hypothetical protein
MQVEAINDATINAIMQHNLVFVSAQPDTVYFHWQTELYLYQFAKHGIAGQCFALFGHSAAEPSEGLRALMQRNPNVRAYKDDRAPQQQQYTHKYIPSIRPHLLKQFFAEHPELGKNVFYHDSDILLVKLPRFEMFLAPEDSNGYLSDTVSYIGYDYIADCAKRYKTAHPALPENDILLRMCECAGVEPEMLKSNQQNAGGAQYLLKNIDAAYWEACEAGCHKLYNMMKEYEAAHPVGHHIQSWTTDMWVVLWEYWKRGGRTVVHKELDFSWGTSSIDEYYDRTIFHLAGVTEKTCGDKFFKGKYISTDVFKEYVKNPNMFAHVSKTNATYGYVSVLKEFVEANEARFGPVAPLSEEQRQQQEAADYNYFTITFEGGKAYSGEYAKDVSTVHFDKPLWRTNKGFIIFFNGTSWILTHSRYENEISPTCGGFVCCSDGEAPYRAASTWNQPCVISNLLVF